MAYCGVCGSDVHIFHGQMADRVVPPQVIGHEMSGEIAKVGSQVKGWCVGDRVVVRPRSLRQLCRLSDGAFAHLLQAELLGRRFPRGLQGSLTVPARMLHRLPENLSLGKPLAALIEPLAVACHDIRRVQLGAGEDAVVIGGGPIGVLIALAAKHRGPRSSSWEINPFRVSLARDLGFDVVNPMEADLPKLVRQRTEGAGAHVAFEVSGVAAGAGL